MSDDETQKVVMQAGAIGEHVVIRVVNKCIVFLSPTQARVLAADLIDAADEIDPPKPVPTAPQVVDGASE